MCGRVFVKSSVDELVANFAFAAHPAEAGSPSLGPRYNGSPGQEFSIIVREPDFPGGMFIWARWGLIPHDCNDPDGGRKPINARAGRVAHFPTCRRRPKDGGRAALETTIQGN